MDSRVIKRLAIVALLAAVAIAPTGCRFARRATLSSGIGSQVATGAGSQAASGAVTGAGTGQLAPGTAAPLNAATGKKGLSAQDASSLDAQLSAIQTELDSLSMPGDGDFNGIESGLK